LRKKIHLKLIFLVIYRHANPSLIKSDVLKSRQWHGLESSVGVLRLRNCDKKRYFLRKKACTHPICEARSAAIKIQLISIRKAEIIFFFAIFLNGHVETNQQLPIKIYMDIRISRYWFSTNQTFDFSWRFFTFGRLR
jgi:hypothetical protein